MAEHVAKHCLTSSSKELRASEARLGGGDPCYVDHPAEATTHVQQGNCYLEINCSTSTRPDSSLLDSAHFPAINLDNPHLVHQGYPDCAVQNTSPQVENDRLPLLLNSSHLARVTCRPSAGPNSSIRCLHAVQLGGCPPRLYRQGTKLEEEFQHTHHLHPGWIPTSGGLMQTGKGPKGSLCCTPCRLGADPAKRVPQQKMDPIAPRHPR